MMASVAWADEDARDDYRLTRAFPKFVNCDKGDSIQRAVDRAWPGNTIRIKGKCWERVTIVKSRITLAGAPYGGVDGEIAVVGARQVVIDNLHVTGDGNGVAATENAAVTVQYSRIKGNASSGVVAAEGAVVILIENSITDNANYGVLATDGGNLQIRGNNIIESDVPSYLTGAAIGGFRQTMVHITGGGNTITNTAFEPPTNPGNSSSAKGFAIDIANNSHLRQDRGDATINGNIEILNLTSADIRQAEINGWVFVDGLSANLRLRNSTFVGGLNMYGEAQIRNNVDWTGDAFCNGKFLNPSQPITGNRINCSPPPPPPPPAP